MGSIPELRRFPGEGNGNPLHYASLENPTEKSLAGYTIRSVTKEPDTSERLNNNHKFLLQGCKHWDSLKNVNAFKIVLGV